MAHALTADIEGLTLDIGDQPEPVSAGFWRGVMFAWAISLPLWVAIFAVARGLLALVP